MTPQIMRFSIAFFIFLSVSSCISELDFELPEHQKVLGINCILTHLEYAHLQVYYSKAVTDTAKQKNLFGAQVKITRNDGILYPFDLSEDSSCYISSIQILEGYSYSLEVNYEDKTYLAETSVPIGITSAVALHDYGKYYNEYEEGLTDLTIEFDDDKDQMNYYQLFLIDRGNSNNIYVRNFWSYYNISDPVLIEESLLDYNPSSFIFSDINTIDNRFKIELFGYFGHTSENPCPSDLILRSISPEYFEFLKSWFIHFYNQNNQRHVEVIDDLDPYSIFFQEQPTPLYSNIKGGTGIFAGYSEYRTNFVDRDE
jgi:hypothetical protein